MINDRRRNGFTFPLDKSQIFSWLILIYFGVMFLGTFCAAMTAPWSFVIGVVFILLYAIHLALNVTVMAIDPSEDSDKQKVTPVNRFDRKKHKHVIENQFCNICQIVVSCKAKHCRKCNKCVTNFDHHCVYLNNCIGQKNYKLFILTVTSAFLGSCYIFIIGLFTFSYSFKKDQSFIINKKNDFNNSITSNETIQDRELPVMFIQSHINVWRSFICVTTCLSLIALILIGYLIAYHVYLKVNNMTTYEHTLKLRLKENQEKSPDDKTTSLTCIKITQSTKINKLPEKQTTDDKIQVKQFEEKNIFTASSALSQANSLNLNSGGLPCISYKNDTNRYLKVDYDNEMQHSSDTSKLSSFRSDNQELYNNNNNIKLPPIMPVTKTKSKIVKLPINFDDEDTNQLQDDNLSLRVRSNSLRKNKFKSNSIDLNKDEL